TRGRWRLNQLERARDLERLIHRLRELRLRVERVGVLDVRMSRRGESDGILPALRVLLDFQTELLEILRRQELLHRVRSLADRLLQLRRESALHLLPKERVRLRSSGPIG